MAIQEFSRGLRIMITGANGQVGWELTRSLLPLGEVVALDRSQCDLSRPETLSNIVNEIKPNMIVNAAAYTSVDEAEKEETLANTINGTAVGVLADEARKQNALFVHYSTDYVFDGNKPTPYTEVDTPNPINAYGLSKLAGEKSLRQVNDEYLIFRTSWVYATRGNNFLRTIIRLSQEREELGIVADQAGVPTWARLISETTAYCIRQSMLERKQGTFSSDIYHLTATGQTSWFGFAKKIVELISPIVNEKSKLSVVKPIKTVEYPTPAKRPMNSCMTIDKLEQHFGLKMPKWDSALKLCLEDNCIDILSQ